MARIFVGQATDMEKSSSRSVEASGRQIALFRNTVGDYYATQDSCTHEQWSLGEDGELADNEVTCPLHLACFDIRTGAALSLPATVALATYPVEIDADDRVYVVVPDG
jgi:nitrite reductase/ring-hydroxylating ferredoxin subunit